MKNKLSKFKHPLLILGVLIGLPIAIAAANTPNQKTPETNQVSTVKQAAPTPEPQPVCRTEEIPYQKETAYSSSHYKGYSAITTVGIDGERKICTKSGAEVSNDIMRQPVNEVATVGTYEKPVQSYTRTGAICSDGTRSYATGRGACSWHGGVSRWLYE